MDNPSWLDVVKASYSSCFPCFSSSDDYHDSNAAGNSRRPPQSLASLLAEPDSDVDALSLHSNINGRNTRRVLKKKRRRNITFFGLNLFGARKGPIYLADDDEDGNTSDTGSTSNRFIRSRRTSSSSGFDSDASPLDPAALDELSPSDLARRAAEAETAARAEAEAKEERRRRRREKKEIKRLAAQLAQDPNDEFEGFQGSGGALPSPWVTRPPGQEDYPQMPSFGRSSHREDEDEDVQDGGADFDGDSYVQKQRRGAGGSHSGGSSSSRSGATESSGSNPIPRPNAHRKKKSISTRSGTTLESASLASPTSPGTILPPTSLEHVKEDFPSPGFGVRVQGVRDGAFLASRGNEAG